MKTKKQKSYQKGLWAEALAALYLMLKGYRILAMRYKTSFGEIDLIALKSKALVFIEVKARADRNDALYAVSERSQMRIENAARLYISSYPQYADYALRFDLMAFGQKIWPVHIAHAWTARS